MATTTYRISKEELLQLLPALPPESNRKLSPSAYNGLMAETADPHHFLNTVYDGKTGVVNTIANVDFRSQNAHRRRLLTFGPAQKHIIESVNQCLIKEKSTAETAFMTVLGAVQTGAGIFFAAHDLLTKQTTPVLVREGDEAWQLERFGKVGSKIVYASYVLLIDPYRAAHNDKRPCEWVVHEERMDVI